LSSCSASPVRSVVNVWTEIRVDMRSTTRTQLYKWRVKNTATHYCVNELVARLYCGLQCLSPSVFLREAWQCHDAPTPSTHGKEQSRYTLIESRVRRLSGSVCSQTLRVASDVSTGAFGLGAASLWNYIFNIVLSNYMGYYLRF